MFVTDGSRGSALRKLSLSNRIGPQPAAATVCVPSAATVHKDTAERQTGRGRPRPRRQNQKCIRGTTEKGSQKTFVRRNALAFLDMSSKHKGREVTQMIGNLSTASTTTKNALVEKNVNFL